ncbi:MAG: ATP-binding cassette domain-containing protein [Clostridia bacterium]|nr:ATP-binding cassette domain-containing protein [Clostridia bacterium]
MLQLKNIKKDYYVADTTVHALQGISLSFRRNEFVSILGASGCGKTTLLNIIGGLDHYTSGDLVIEGTSTKDYKDGDWDTYRNHRIGFVFQTYNLIPHQTVLGNVELALTLSGVSKKERRQRAADALRRVGLGNEINKKPNQLSGGQMQRVAIARALVNEPEILLADEPTGALDTKTSVQIMDLIKEIAGERLVIMVTHNPELANKYSSRIVELKDGHVISDSNPYSPAEEEAEVAHFAKNGGAKVQGRTIVLNGSNFGTASGKVTIGGIPAKVTYWSDTRVDVLTPEGAEGNVEVVVKGKHGVVNRGMCEIEPTAVQQKQQDTAKPNVKKKQTSMSYLTAFALSGRNLLTKKTRTLITAIAGSIGIISVCLVLALSSGFNSYIKRTEEDMLSYYPVEVDEASIDLTELMTSFMGGGTSLDLDEIGDKVYVNSLLTNIALGATTTNDINQGGFKDKGYNVEYDSYLDFVEDMPADYYNAIHYEYGISLTSNLFTSVNIGSETTSMLYSYQKNSDGGYGFDQVMSLAAVKSYYSSTLASNDVFASLAYYVSYLGDIVSVMPGTSSDDLANGTFMDYVLSQYDVLAGDVSTSGSDAANQIILVIGSQNDVSDLTLAQLGLVSEEDFLEMFINASDEDADIKTEYDFDEILGKKYTLYYNDAIYTDNTDDASGSGYAYDYVSSSKYYKYNFDTTTGTLTGLSQPNYLSQGWKADNSLEATEDEGIELEISAIVRLKDDLSYGCLESGLNFTESLVENYIQKNMQSSIVNYINSNSNSSDFSINKIAYPLSYTAYEEYFNDGYSTTDEVVRALGGDDTPQSIEFYAKDFDSKEDMLTYLDGWNTIAEEQQAQWKAKYDTATLTYTDSSGETVEYDGPTEITYSDTVGTLMGLVDTILNAITYVLVAFTAISLVVSTVMIGVITYVSVVERTKEIGVLRSIGARKKDIRHVFNAETFIIGLISGLIGIGVAYLLQVVINLILTPLTGISGLAALPFWQAIIMVVVSVVLTLISGLIPASAAAKKDPVVCLRTE